jgi:gluconolactonase
MPNGIGLSPEGRTLYSAETNTGNLWAYEIERPGTIRPSSPHVGRYLKGPHDYTSYDSLAVEDCGNICIANLVRSGIEVISPEGDHVEFIPLPDPLPTNICFGGPDMMTAYITLSATGQLIRTRWPRPGLRLNFA